MTDYKLSFTVLCVSLPCLATLFVFLRLQAKSFKAQSKRFALTSDDWLIVVAVLLSYGWSVDVLIGVYIGNLGGHSEIGEDGGLLPGRAKTVFMKTSFVAQLMVNPIMGTVKISIVLLYGNIFNGYRFRNLTKLLVAVLALWSVVFFLANLFSCWPIESQWYASDLDGCADLYSLFMAATISNTITDFIVLCWPLYEISRLKLPLTRKILVAFMFALGGGVVITGIFRIYYVSKAHDIISDTYMVDLSYTYSLPFLWSTVEINIGIICACAPILRPLYKAYRLDVTVDKLCSLLSPCRSFFTRNRSVHIDLHFQGREDISIYGKHAQILELSRSTYNDDDLQKNLISISDVA